MNPYRIGAGIMAVTLAVGFAEGEYHPHTTANAFDTVYTSTDSGRSAERLIVSEGVEFLQDIVTPNTPVNPVTFTLP